MNQMASGYLRLNDQERFQGLALESAEMPKDND